MNASVLQDTPCSSNVVFLCNRMFYSHDSAHKNIYFKKIFKMLPPLFELIWFFFFCCDSNATKVTCARWRSSCCSKSQFNPWAAREPHRRSMQPRYDIHTRVCACAWCVICEWVYLCGLRASLCTSREDRAFACMFVYVVCGISVVVSLCACWWVSTVKRAIRCADVCRATCCKPQS